jgi:hypothetical protein
MRDLTQTAYEAGRSPASTEPLWSGIQGRARKRPGVVYTRIAVCGPYIPISRNHPWFTVDGIQQVFFARSLSADVEPNLRKVRE